MSFKTTFWLPYLEIRKPSSCISMTKLQCIDIQVESQSLALQQNISVSVVAPTVQFGRIVGIMPIDEAPTPNAIQTDIVATGDQLVQHCACRIGRSSSDAQQVLCCPSYGTRHATPYTAKIGLVYGVTNQILYRMSEAAVTIFREEQADRFGFPCDYFHGSKLHEGMKCQSL